MQYSYGFWIITLATQLRSEAQCRQHWTPRPSANHFPGTEMSKAQRTLLKNVVQNKQPTGQWYFKFHFPLSISSRILLNLVQTHISLPWAQEQLSDKLCCLANNQLNFAVSLSIWKGSPLTNRQGNLCSILPQECTVQQLSRQLSPLE